MDEDESTSDDDFVLSSPSKGTRSSSKVPNSAKNSKKVKVKEEDEEINEEDETKEFQCYYCGKMIVSLKNVKEHMREKHRRFHR